MLVCKRWHDAIFAIPELWRELALVPSNSMPENRQRWLDSKARLLQRVGQHVHRVQLSQQAGLLVAETLLPAIGPQLQHLSWNTPVALLPDALPHRFPQLQRLWLSSDTLPACVTAVLPQLPLTDLDITARQSPYMRLPELPDGLVGSILQLTALSRLRLTSTHAPLPPGLEQLTRLRRLRHLRLADGYSRAQGETLRVPPPAAFPELRSCELRAALNRVLQVRAVQGPCFTLQRHRAGPAFSLCFPDRQSNRSHLTHLPHACLWRRLATAFCSAASSTLPP